MRTHSTRKSGFTLVEILIVVIILGILAAIVIPQFTNASQDARRSSLQSTVQSLRSQISLYKLQHQDVTPSSTAATFWNQLTLYTDDTGATNATKSATFQFGPYIQSIPENGMVPSVNSTVLTATATDPPVTDAGASAYFYHSTSGKIWAQGKNDSGTFTIIGD